MPWFKVDDNLGFHHKVIAAGNPAMGLWVRAGSICAQQLTDGFVPEHMVLALGTKAQAEKLVSVALWDRAQGGYRFHGWDERQPSKVDVEAERAAAKERMRAARAKKRQAAQQASAQLSDERSGDVRANTDRTSGEVRETFGNPDPTHPIPARPDPPVVGRKRAHQLPQTWQPNDTHRAFAAENRLNLNGETAKFRDHHAAKGSTMKDWDAAFRNWLRNSLQWGGAETTPKVRNLPAAQTLELPPDGLSADEYRQWQAEQRRRA